MGTPWVSFNGKDCYGCKHLNERGYCEFTACIIPCTVRATIPEVKPKTNYDRIRSMSSVEELATFLFHAWNNASWCSAKDCPDEDSCLPCWIDWLKQECE